MQSRIRTPIWLCLLAVAVLGLDLKPIRAQPPEVFRNYVKTDALIPTRDGVKLNTAIFAPRNGKGPFPFLLLRTPYGIDNVPERSREYFWDLAEEGYIFVLQDIRGRYKSEGRFVMLRNPRDAKDPKAIDESTDTYDTLDWLLKHVPNHNGRAGMLGISYPGWLTVMGMLDPHPALQAVSPQASPADMFLGDDFHHNGAFRLSYGFEYVARMETSNVNFTFPFDRFDTYEWYLKLGPLARVNEKYFHGQRPTWNDFVAHPDYDDFWKKQALAPHLRRVTVPTLNVAGWWDQEDFYGPLEIYKRLEKHDADQRNLLVVGPWNHGGWAHGDGASLGRIKFDSATGKHFRSQIQAPWFAYHLKGRGRPEPSEALTFQTGSNQWISSDRWPPRGATARNLYFHPEGRLSFKPPAANNERGFDAYISDPNHPVPYRPRPIEPTYPGPRFPNPGWDSWLVEDQRFVHLRSDVLSWETEPLQEDVVLAGDVVAHLFASTSGSDSDWVVKLIDVYPENYADDVRMAGYQLMVANEVFRGRYRKSFERPEPIPPNVVKDYTIDLHWAHHCFKKGHRIMVQVQSTWFPVIDRNPQKYVANIFLAKASDYQRAEQRVFRSPKFPSNVTLTVRQP
ncbi:MAG: CocE/NonD family hydrolase [Gemmataceae bacterium]|nr:CocE/NonD family hydrolase [Gemmataceae bacterium]